MAREEMLRVHPHRLPVIGDLMPRRRPFASRIDGPISAAITPPSLLALESHEIVEGAAPEVGTIRRDAELADVAAFTHVDYARRMGAGLPRRG